MVGSAAPKNMLETAEAMLAPVEVDWEWSKHSYICQGWIISDLQESSHFFANDESYP
jgi:hypothetical protein